MGKGQVSTQCSSLRVPCQCLLICLFWKPAQRGNVSTKLTCQCPFLRCQGKPRSALSFPLWSPGWAQTRSPPSSARWVISASNRFPHPSEQFTPPRGSVPFLTLYLSHKPLHRRLLIGCWKFSPSWFHPLTACVLRPQLLWYANVSVNEVLPRDFFLPKKRSFLTLRACGESLVLNINVRRVQLPSSSIPISTKILQVFVCAHTHSGLGAVEMSLPRHVPRHPCEERLVGISSLLPPCWAQGSNSSCQAWQQEPFSCRSVSQALIPTF